MMVCLMAELTSISVYLKHSVSAIAEFSSFRLRGAHLLGANLDTPGSLLWLLA